MNKSYRTLLAGVLSILFVGPALAHETPNMKHSHAFERSGDGTIRQGHSVNNELGRITIWSAKPYDGYASPPPVRFARPQPILKAPKIPLIAPRRQPAREYGEPKPD